MPRDPTPRPWPALALAALVLGVAGCGGDESVRALANVRAPPAVADLTATAGDGFVRLNWDPLEIDQEVVGYQIYRAASPDGPFELIGSVGQADRPWFEDRGADEDRNDAADGLTNGLRYYYKVVGFTAHGFTGLLKIAPMAEALPSLPVGSFRDLQVRGLRVYSGPGKVLLTWEAIPSNEVFGYRVYREVATSADPARELAIVAATRRHFTDASARPGEEYIYSVAPLSRDVYEGRIGDCNPDAQGDFRCTVGVEGRRLRSRAVELLPGDATVPLAPGHDLQAGTLVVTAQGDAGVSLSWGRPVQNTDGSFFRTEQEADDLIGGGYVVYRGPAARGPFEPVAVIEVLGSEVVHTFTDPIGTEDHVYMVRAFDRHGTLGLESRRVSAGGTSLPDLVRGLDAFGSTGLEQVLLNWDALPTATAGYRIFRSRRRDFGYQPIGDSTPEQNFFVDPTVALGSSVWYRVAPLTLDGASRVVAGALGAPAAATAGPSSGVFYLEAEDAAVEVGAGSAAAIGEVNREGRGAPFSDLGALRVSFTDQVAPGVTTLTLRWVTDVATEGAPATALMPGSYRAFLRLVRDPMTPRADLLFSAEGSILGGGASAGRLGVDLFRERFGTPLRPTMIPLGDFVFEDRNLGTGTPAPETFALAVTVQDPPPGLVGNGRLLLDAVVLVKL